MRNPLKRHSSTEPKPTLRERAASLKATAGRVMSGAKPDPKAVPDVPDARAFAVEQAALIDLSALSIMQLGVLFERFDAASNAWSAELHLPYADEREAAFRINTAAGDVLEREQERVAEIRDRIAAEIARRQPTGPQDADTQLETLIRHELMCNGDLRDPAIRARIEVAWGSAPAHDATAENVEPSGNLHAIGREFDAAHEAWRRAVEANQEPSRRHLAYLEAAKARGGLSNADIRAAEALPGVSEASETEERAFEAAGELSLTILKLPARTLGDLAAQARAVIPHVWASGSYEEDGAPDADENIDKEAVRSLIESCCAAAAVDWRGSTGTHAPNHRARQIPPASNFLPSPDFEAMSMRTLDTLREHAVVLSLISHGLASQPRSKSDDGEHSNEAGTFAVQLAEALGFIVDGCVNEARRRRPDDVSDREIRIKTLALATLDNGDAAETRAFACDVLALLKA
ncbi:hypothetical protein [Methylobacterium sp. WL120]|uniref:hypothetical protein n=1 Tax=Methylobacterium sp. WL120 TaxID=2603887 RepID=UPI0011CC68B2|nr:hypothetical protein [Methylobacterium sp. WL120]TXM63967.1 hypothetical protein FV229_20320 [Methylobacterium sp. WL120]